MSAFQMFLPVAVYLFIFYFAFGKGKLKKFQKPQNYGEVIVLCLKLGGAAGVVFGLIASTLILESM